MTQGKSAAPRTVSVSRVFSKWTRRRRLTFSTSSRKPRWPSVNARSSGRSSSSGKWLAVSALLCFFRWPRSREFFWAGGVVMKDMLYSQSVSARAVRSRASLRVRKSKGWPAPSNQALERTPPRCALRRRSAPR